MPDDAVFGMQKAPGKDQTVDSVDPGQTPEETIACSGDAFVIATGLQAIAAAIRELAKAYSAELVQEVDEPQPQFDMAGKPIS